MKCKMCGKKTDWDSSVGKDNFLICNDCVEVLHNYCDIERADIVNMILVIGIVRGRQGNEH